MSKQKATVRVDVSFEVAIEIAPKITSIEYLENDISEMVINKINATVLPSVLRPIGRAKVRSITLELNGGPGQ